MQIRGVKRVVTKLITVGFANNCFDSVFLSKGDPFGLIKLSVPDFDTILHLRKMIRYSISTLVYHI